jgi:ABC-type dipeptide/oligopeptide/nickel transport system permease subunit
MVGLLQAQSIGCLLVWWCLTPLSTLFSYIVAVSFIGGGNRRTVDSVDDSR